MKSMNMFDGNELQKPRETRPLWLVLMLASLLPGLGHFLLGRSREGAALLLSFIAAQIAAGVALGLEISILDWAGIRAITLIYLFGVVDAALLCAELRDRREGPDPRPRVTGFGNLLFYGVGYWQTDRRGIAVVAMAFGVVVHILGGSIHLLVQLVTELGVLALAYHGYQVGLEDANLHNRSTDELGQRRRVADTTPGWLMPTLMGFCVVQIALVAFASIASSGLVAAMEVDQSKSLVVQPYYRNSEYGVELEMNAPGWSFTDTLPHEFVSARHVSEGSAMRLLMRPRFLGFPDSQTYAYLVLGESIENGYSLYESSSGPTRLGGARGWRLRAAGQRKGRPLEVEILTVGKGFRQYILWFEWDPRNAEFGQGELNHLLAGLELEGRSWSTQETESAR